MCAALIESPVDYGLPKAQTSKQPHLTKVEKLLARLPKLGEEYELDRKVGEGTFSSVYLGRSRLDPKLRVAIKHLIPTCHPARIARELKCMHHLGGKDNIVEVISCYRMHDCVVFVMPYQPHDKFSSYMGHMNINELQTYLHSLLVALRRVHSYGIIHRDIKPSNFLFHRRTNRCLLVDFGLAQNVEECTRGDNGENFTSIKIEPIKSQTGDREKKRKRDNTEEVQVGGDLQVVKRLALQPISNNISASPREAKMSCRSDHLSTDTAKYPLKSQSLLMAESSSVFSKDFYPKSKEKSIQQSPVVKRRPFSNQSAVQQNGSFVRIQNSQVKLVGGLFAKPLPLSTSPAVNKTSPFQSKKCHCDGRPRVCNMCITRRARAAPRAGTPGFRPPEVLLKHANQTTAVDMWAVGVIMLSVMSSTYPFFRSPDDITALAELITVFGSEEMKALANKFGRNIVCSEKRGPLDLKKLCRALRGRKSGEENMISTMLSADCCMCKMARGQVCLCPSTDDRSVDIRFPDEAYDLLYRFLDIDPDSRITAEEALKHPFFSLNL